MTIKKTRRPCRRQDVSCYTAPPRHGIEQTATVSHLQSVACLGRDEKKATLFAQATANKAKGLMNCILCHVPSALRTSRWSNNTPYKVSMFPAAYNLIRTRLRSVSALASVPATNCSTILLVGCLVANAASRTTSLTRLFIANASPGNLGDTSAMESQGKNH